MAAGVSRAGLGVHFGVRRVQSVARVRRKQVRAILASLAAGLLVGSILTACAPEPAPTGPTALEARVDGETQPTVTPAVVPEPGVAGISELGTASAFIAGVPMEIAYDGELPESGATLTRTYAAPLPEDAVATFAFWDTDYEVWTAVPTTLSQDRRTITAVVHHFSLWDDFIAGSQQAIQSAKDAASAAGQAVSEWAGQVTTAAGDAVASAGEALHWSVGNMFSTRVELPECDTPTPNWVLDLPAGFEVDDPVRFCVGHDASRPDLLVVKARANRGYGFPVALAASPSWEYNSTSENNLGSVIETVGQLDAVIGESISQLLNDGRFVGAGEEISFGIPATSFKDYSSEFFIELPAPSAPQFIAGAVSQQVIAWGMGRTEGFLAATLAVANCWSQISTATDIGKTAGATLSCLSGADEKVAQILGQVLLARGMEARAAGNLAGKLIGRVSMALAMLPAAIAAADYIAEVNFPRNVRALTIDVDEDALSTVPGFPDEIQGEWCTRPEAPEQECFSLAALAQEFPDLTFGDASPYTAGATSYKICLVLDMGDSCSMAGRTYYLYLPAGVDWDCNSMNTFGMVCDPDYSSLHDASEPRIMLLYNHQQDVVYHDTVPMYRK